jgi:two-component system cell cycle sensor histidine kinase/response regulator CckA
VKKAAERAVALTRQILAFSRKQILQPVVLNLNQIASGVEKMLRRILGEDIDYLQVLAPALGLVRADPGQIEQVLVNLVVNARDAMPNGGKLTVETRNVELDAEYAACHVAVAPGPYICFAVTDTGCGMDKETRERIFEPFFTTKEKGKGTGLGLSTVYGIVKQSGGNIWVYSEPGQGTTFKIYLPRDLSASLTVSGSRFAAVTTPPTGTETILVVEDEEAVRDIAKRILREAGYNVLAAASPDDALLTCKSHLGKLHLLLTDVVMPQMSGKLLADRLAMARPGLKVLYMSGYADDAILHHGTLAPGTHFIGKPFSAVDLARKVREVLDSSVASPADRHSQPLKADAEMKQQPLDMDAQRAPPHEVVAKLRRAVIAARYDEIVEIIETLRSTDPNLATELRRMADAFDYDGLRGLLI